ncbi:hypothetical protein WJX81_003451 [Elliptochloris bilobata]|uniref:Uncharacterized protein n=1 Tax=Elliptochloris bilobata TaxID=381761 RepID=A0AAW1S2J8_9CHLO
MGQAVEAHGQCHFHSSRAKPKPPDAGHRTRLSAQVHTGATMAIRACMCAGLVLVLASVVRAEVQYTDMQKWAGLLAQSFLAHSETREHAHTQLAQFKELVNSKIADAAAGKDFHSHGLQSSTPSSHSLLHGAVTVNDPALYVDSSSKIVTSISGATLAATFLSYAPCLILTQPYGFGVFPDGVNVQPTGVYIVPTGFNVQPQGFNVAPTLIYVGPVGKNIAPQGFNVAPALISVAPVYDSVGTPGKDVSGDPFIKTVTLPRDGVGEPTVVYAP